jgi:uncharacterized membrane protein YjfL (UPF0719 family)
MQFFTTAAGSHLVAFMLAVALLAVFTRFYVWFTPYNEFEEIRKGHVAPAVSLVGAMVGFTIPLIVAMLVTTSTNGFGFWLGMFMVWAIFVCIVQLVCFKVMYWFMPNQIESNNIAAAIYYAGASVCIGALNAVCIIP